MDLSTSDRTTLRDLAASVSDLAALPLQDERRHRGEPLHDRIDGLRKIPKLRRLSISPWCDVRIVAEAFGPTCIMSYKPSPTFLSTSTFDEDALGKLITESLAIFKRNGCNVEVIMKDLQSVQSRPERIRRYVEITRNAIRRVYG